MDSADGYFSSGIYRGDPPREFPERFRLFYSFLDCLDHLLIKIINSYSTVCRLPSAVCSLHFPIDDWQSTIGNFTHFSPAENTSPRPSRFFRDSQGNKM